MLRLTDSELDIVIAAARPLAVQDRDPFLRAVAERLEAMPERGDGIVHRVVAEVQPRYFDAPLHVARVGRRIDPPRPAPPKWAVLKGQESSAADDKQ